MRLTIAAVGRMRPGAELTLVRDYLDRAAAAGRGLGLTVGDVREVDERKVRDRPLQSGKLLAMIPSGATAVALDERGEHMTSTEFAGMIERERDGGVAEMVFLIGGPDGHDESLRSTTGYRLAFGPMVWPHMLARVMLAEQIYRGISILSGSPYHRV